MIHIPKTIENLLSAENEFAKEMDCFTLPLRACGLLQLSAERNHSLRTFLYECDNQNEITMYFRPNGDTVEMPKMTLGLGKM